MKAQETKSKKGGVLIRRLSKRLSGDYSSMEDAAKEIALTRLSTGLDLLVTALS